MSALPPHRAAAAEDPRTRSARVAVLTVSDTRTAENDHSGDRAAALLEADGHRAAARTIVPDEPAQIRAALMAWIDDSAIDLVVSIGGTGIAARDTTVEVARSLIATPMEGFGELFRRVSFDDIGSASMLSRAIGGIVQGERGATLLFCLPGSPHAVETALTRLILPEIPHMLALVKAGGAAEDPAHGAGGGGDGLDHRQRRIEPVHGIDLAEVARIERLLAEHPERFLARCFTDQERRYAQGTDRARGERFAARFAAKEAALKALGTGWRDGIAWTDVEVVNEPSGRPTLVLHGPCAERAAALGISHWALSLTHAGGFAFASVVGT